MALSLTENVHGDDQHVAFNTSDQAPGPGEVNGNQR
jgi:hypothetical protein